MSAQKVRVVHSGMDKITDSGVLLASASNAIIIDSTCPDRGSAKLAARENVETRLHSIIHELRDEMAGDVRAF